MAGFINVRKDGSSIWHSNQDFKFTNSWDNALGKVVWNLTRHGRAEKGNLKDVDLNVGAKFSIWVTAEVESFVIDGKIDFGSNDSVDMERLDRFIEVLGRATMEHGSKSEGVNMAAGNAMKELGF